MPTFDHDFKTGDEVVWTYRDKHGVLRSLTGVVLWALNLITIRCDGGQPGYRKGKHLHLLPSELKHLKITGGTTK